MHRLLEIKEISFSSACRGFPSKQSLVRVLPTGVGSLISLSRNGWKSEAVYNRERGGTNNIFLSEFELEFRFFLVEEHIASLLATEIFSTAI